MARLLLFIALFALSRPAWARPQYAIPLPGPFKERCDTCHMNLQGGGPLNDFGRDFENAGRDLAAILDMDSDGDGFTNREELRAGTMPGDPNSRPGAAMPAAVSQNAFVGVFSLSLAFLILLLGAGVLIWAVMREQYHLLELVRRSLLASGWFVWFATLALVLAFIENDFQLEYVAQHSNRTLPLAYRISGLWGGQEGSLLFWLAILAAYVAAAIASGVRREGPRFEAGFLGTIIVVEGFFFLLLLFFTPPFRVLSRPLQDGAGLNPLLQHPAMFFHPPTLYLGYVGMTIPFALAVAALLSGRLGPSWVRRARIWILIPWIFLTAGIILGGVWAYMELGWGGYWAWDPVENASFMPWLSGTALLHSIMVQERRNMLRLWNFVLIFLTFWLTLLGTFITRSGLISSVHSFSNTGLGVPFLYFIALTFVAGILAIAYRWGELSKDETMETIVSREGFFVLNNWIFLSLVGTVLYGTMYPIFSELFTGRRGDLGAPYYALVTTPLFLIMLFLTGSGPLLTWGRASWNILRRNLGLPLITGAIVFLIAALLTMRFLASVSYGLGAFVVATAIAEYARGIRARRRLRAEPPLTAFLNLLRKNARRYGGFVVHLGIGVIAIGITTSSVFKQVADVTLARGESTHFAGATVTYRGLRDRSTPNFVEVYAELEFVTDGKRRVLKPARRRYSGLAENTSTEIAIWPTLAGDYYAVLVSWEGNGEQATFRFWYNPLIWLVWLGGLLIVGGGLLTVLFSLGRRSR